MADRIREIMTEHPAVCTADTGLEKVAQMMVECDCGAIPVVESQESRKAIGVVTDRDIAIRIIAKGRNPLEATASDAMTRNVVSIRADEGLERASDLMEEHQVRRLIVVDEQDRCIGILAQADVARKAPMEMVGELVEGVSEPSRQRH